MSRTFEEIVADYMRADVLDDFTRAGKVHDWRNHVPRELIEIWPTLPVEVKAAVYMCAEEAASDEEWD